MSNIVNLVSQQDTDYLAFLAYGEKRIMGNREFCGLSKSTFFDYLVDGDMSADIMKGLVSVIYWMSDDPEKCPTPILSAHKKLLHAHLQKFLSEHEQLIRQHFNAMLIKQSHNQIQKISAS